MSELASEPTELNTGRPAGVSSGMTVEQAARRRAVEALRSGVPSWDAVAALGSGQPEAEDRFTELLDAVGQPPGGGRAGGLLVGGGFGAGKSHLLTHLAHLALESGFVASTVVISKETPLHDPAKTFRAAVETATGPGRIHGVLPEAAAALDPDTPRYAELSRWLAASGTDVDERFAATLDLHERLRGGEVAGADETVDAILRFWSGDPLRMPDLRRALKTAGLAGRYQFTPIRAAELARHRFAFVARLLRAAGFTGWVILFDEVELIGRYSLLQRGRSYAELARWLGGAPGGLSSESGGLGAPLVPILAMTDDFESFVLSQRNDREIVPAKLRAKQTPEWDEITGLAEVGIRHIERDLLQLSPPDDAELDRTYTTLKQLHADAFGWSPPDVAGLERLGATRMRQYVRAWINEWDLVRLDPAYRPHTETVEVQSDYRERDELDGD